MKNYGFLILLLMPFLGMAQNETANKSLSPYFLVRGANKGTDALPLKNTAAEVNIAGVVADVVIVQTYINTGKKPLEAIYTFPASENAAVYGLTMKIGTRLITAKIAERNAARTAYENAKSEGKRASLLEQERPNVFQMNVANIMPDDTILVTLRYTELLVPESGDYEFVFPTVVGPRYVNGKSHNNNGFTATPYQHQGKKPHYDFDLSLHLAAGMLVNNVQSPTHQITATNNGNAGVNILLDKTEKKGGNRDFILRYSLKNEEIGAGLLLFDDGEEKFFMCMAQPPKQVELSDIPPREYVFVVDVSGSMNGFPLDVSKKLLSQLIGGLRTYDRFNVILFAGTSNILSENSLLANQENITKSIEFINNQQGSGGTELLPALQRALKLPRNNDELSRSIIVVTDGYVDVEAEAFDLIRNNLDKANLFAFGIGASVNRHLIDGLAHVGQGVPFIVTDEKEGKKIADKFRKYISTPVFSQVKAHFKGFEAYDVEPSHLPDVFAQRPIVLMGKWRGEAKGEIIIKGFSGKNAKEIRIPVNNSIADDRNSALKYLWARERIKLLGDYNINGNDPKRDETITNLGLKYNLLTAFTSFIAIDETVASDGKPTTVQQELPLPEGVSDLAVGFDLGFEGISGIKINNSGSTPVKCVLSIFALFLLLFVLFFGKKSKSFFMVFLFASTLGFTNCTKIKQIQTCEGDSISFIVGADHSTKNPYFTHASTYFRLDPLEKTDIQVNDCSTLTEVYSFLAEHRPINGQWKEIRLVVHSNEWTGLRMPIDDGSPSRTTANLLEKALQNGQFKGLSQTCIDSNSILVVDGCNVGQDTALLRALSRIFCGVPVCAARYFNVFEKKDARLSKVQHYLADCHYVVFPSGKYPGNAAVAQQLAAKYPSDTTNWKSALLRHKPRYTGDSYIYHFNIPIQWTTLYDHVSNRPKPESDTEKLAWVQTQPELIQQLSDMHLRPSDFNWRITPIEYANGKFSQPALLAEGAAKIYGIVLPVKDQSGNLAEANYKNNIYYTRQNGNL